MCYLIITLTILPYIRRICVLFVRILLLDISLTTNNGKRASLAESIEKGKRLVEEQEEITKLLAEQVKLRDSGKEYDEDAINNLIAQKEILEEQINLEEAVLGNLEKRATLEAELEDTANGYLQTFFGKSFTLLKEYHYEYLSKVDIHDQLFLAALF